MLKLPLKSYQQRFLQYAKNKTSVVNVSDKGVGKTAMCYGWIEQQQFRRTLILVESDKVRLGLQQAAKFTTLPTAGLIGTPSQRKAAISSDFRVFIAGYGSLDSQWGRQLYMMEWDAIIADESTNLKRYAAKQTKLAIRLADHIPHKCIMTANLVTNSLFDIWTQYRFVDGGETFNRSFWWFRKQYFYLAGFEWQPRRGAEEKIKKLIEATSFRAVKKDELQMPPKVRRQRPVVLTPGARTLYDALVKDWMLTLKDGTIIDTRHVIAKLSKLRQICSGWVIEGARVSCAKLEALTTLLGTLKKPTVVWCNYVFEVDDVARICHKLRLGHVLHYGDADGGESEHAFQTQSDKQVFITTYRKGARALTLTKACNVVRYGKNPSVELMEQSEDRTHRIGSEHHQHITYYDIFTKNTIEESERAALAHKIFYSHRFVPASDIKKFLLK